MDRLDTLSARLARGEPEAFAAVYDQFGQALYAYLRGLCGDAQTAEDLLQTVMLRLVRHREGLQEVLNLRAWLYVVARNEAYRRGARGIVPTAPADGLRGLQTRADARGEDAEALTRALGALTPERFEVVTLKVHHDLTFAEIGEVLDIPPNTAASRYRRALADLKRLLETADVER